MREKKKLAGTGREHTSIKTDELTSHINSPYYYPGAGDTAALGDPATAAAAAAAAATAMAASAAAYGIPSMASRRSRHPIDVGPYFKPTKQICSIYSMDRTRTYSVRMLPRVDKGFFLADNDWTCYRRNYFQLTASFTCTDSAGIKVELPCLVDVEGRGLRTVTEFQLVISAKTANGARDVELVQHTAKRDKGPQSMPTPRRCEAQDLTHNYAMRMDADGNHAVTFERIQFKSATANNGKRRAAQQYHCVVVELLAKCDDGYMARVATTDSAPLVVRGRAPGHYHAMASKEAQEAGDPMAGNFYYNGGYQGDYHAMMSSQYYYHPYYWANMAANAGSGAPGAANGEAPVYSAEQLAALSGQVAANAAAVAQSGEAVVSHEEEHEEEVSHDEEEEDHGESANMTEATATGTPENEAVDEFDEKRRAVEEASEVERKRRGRPKKA